MTSNRRRKQIARSYQAAHGGDYTAARHATELSPRPDRYHKAAKMLAVARRDVCASLLRAETMAPFREPFLEGLVEALVDKLNAVPPQEPDTDPDDILHRDPAPGLWDVVMAGGWGTTGRVESAEIHAVARFMVAAITALDDPQLVAAATDLRVTERDVNYFSGKAYDLADCATGGRQRVMGASVAETLTGQTGLVAAALRAEEQARVSARIHLRDRSGRTWTELDRIALRQAVLQQVASIGDAFLYASEDLGCPTLPWRRLPDGSMRADTIVPGVAKPVSALLKVRTDSDGPRLSIAKTLGPEYVTAFYPTDRHADGHTYTCYIGVLSETESDLDIDPLVFDEFYSASSDFGQLVSQRLAVEIMAQVRARPPAQLG